MCQTEEIKNYLDKIYKYFEENKINHKKDVICITNDDLGDSWDHPNQAQRKNIQKYFLN